MHIKCVPACTCIRSHQLMLFMQLLRQLQLANAGYLSPLQDCLATAYGRIGHRADSRIQVNKAAKLHSFTYSRLFIVDPRGSAFRRCPPTYPWRTSHKTSCIHRSIESLPDIVAVSAKWESVKRSTAPLATYITRAGQTRQRRRTPLRTLQ